MLENLTSDVLKSYNLACDVRLKAYAPYSKFLVGVALKVKGSEKYFVGCNVENASYGATVCAERVAIFNWVAQKPTLAEDLDHLVLVTDTQDPVAVPCALCLQVISEFCAPKLPIYVANLKGVQKCFHFDELLPSPFSKESL